MKKTPETPERDIETSGDRGSRDPEHGHLGYAQDAGHVGGEQPLDEKTDTEDEDH